MCGLIEYGTTASPRGRWQHRMDCPLCVGQRVMWRVTSGGPVTTDHRPCACLPFQEHGQGISACWAYNWDPGTSSQRGWPTADFHVLCLQLVAQTTELSGKHCTSWEGRRYIGQEFHTCCHQLDFIFGNGPANLWFQKIAKTLESSHQFYW